MTKDHILDEIRRTARENGGAAMGFQRFSNATGIKKSDWYPKHWLRWGDALKEAGHRPNQFTEPITESHPLECLAALMRELGHFPLYGEVRQKELSDPAFPCHTTFKRLGNKQMRVE